jgi:arsenical pump membrane protein
VTTATGAAPAVSHLANSASLLLPVSNLTNLLAFQASGLPSRAPGAVLAMLDVGPNLTYVGLLATLLWRRVVHAHDDEVEWGSSCATVPATLLASTTALWLALHVF